MTLWQLVFRLFQLLLRRDAVILDRLKALEEENGVEVTEESAIRAEFETLVSQMSEQVEQPPITPVS